MMRIAMVAMVAVAALGGCKQARTGQAPVTEAEATKIAETAEATFTTGDLGKVMDQYADNAVMIDASKPDPSADRKVATDSAKTFVSMKPADYRVIGRHIQIVGPDAFVSSGVEQFSVAAGTARPIVSARFTDVFQRQGDGKWKIVAEHVSMPPTAAGKP
jgi:hypothetical protein